MNTMNVQASPAYLAMPDATEASLLPKGYPAYLGYGDGAFATAADLERMFPDASLVILTVMGGTLGAHGARVAVSPGADTEPGDLTAAAAANWARRQLNASPLTRPVMYASVTGEPGYGMPDVMRELTAAGVALSRVRLLSAHYGLGPHICGPASCKAIRSEMDGTQWTDSYQVPGGVVDMSLLHADFFTGDGTLPTETERLVRELGIVRQGDTGEAVKTVQGALLARGFGIGIGGPGRNGIDGVYGDYTRQAVVRAQMEAGFTASQVDGVVGPLTWPVLLGVA